MPGGALRFPRRVDFAAFAGALDVPSLKIGDVNELRRLDLRRWLVCPGPLIIDVTIDPLAVPPILARTRVLGIGGGGQP
jgi:thiamine pyrophosphate-dependent acetolactate synthase large subunit-like protein